MSTYIGVDSSGKVQISAGQLSVDVDPQEFNKLPESERVRLTARALMAQVGFPAGCGSHAGHFAANMLKQTARL
jgi:hypothetical protein